MQHQAVDVHHWVSGREYVELFAIARVTPGPGSMLAPLIGWHVAGLLGAVIATLSLYIPCSVLCFAVAHTWNRYRGTAWHSAIENGLRPIAAGLMISGGVALLRIEDSGLFAWSVALAATLVLIWRPLLHPMVLMAAGAAIFVTAQVFMGL
jgi:chromate transporter